MHCKLLYNVGVARSAACRKVAQAGAKHKLRCMKEAVEGLASSATVFLASFGSGPGTKWSVDFRSRFARSAILLSAESRLAVDDLAAAGAACSDKARATPADADGLRAGCAQEVRVIRFERLSIGP